MATMGQAMNWLRQMNILALLAVATAAGWSVQSQQTAQDRDPSNRAKPTKPLVEVAVQKTDAASGREAPKRKISEAEKTELMQFVRENHSDLERLLNLLEARHPRHYEKAIRSLAHSLDRLKSLKQRDAEKYELALADWKLKSRIQLVAAELALHDRPELKDRLRKLIGQQLHLRQQQLKLEAARSQKRLNRIQAQLNQMRTNRDEEIDRQMALAIKATQRLQPSQVNAENGDRRDANNKKANRNRNQAISDKQDK